MVSDLVMTGNPTSRASTWVGEGLVGEAADLGEEDLGGVGVD